MFHPDKSTCESEARSGHSHRCRCHSCDQTQEVVKWSRGVFRVSEAIKDNLQTRLSGQDAILGGQILWPLALGRISDQVANVLK